MNWILWRKSFKWQKIFLRSHVDLWLSLKTIDSIAFANNTKRMNWRASITKVKTAMHFKRILCGAWMVNNNGSFIGLIFHIRAKSWSCWERILSGSNFILFCWFEMFSIYFVLQNLFTSSFIKINFTFFDLFSLQGIPSCPVNFEALRSHLPDLGCFAVEPEKEGNITSDPSSIGCNNNNNFIVSDVDGASQKDQFNLTPLHRFYKQQQQQKKMPGFRGRRGLCGCLQVSFWRWFCGFYLYTNMPNMLKWYNFDCKLRIN